MRRSRAINTVVREDVSALDETRRVLRFEGTIHHQSDAMRSAAQAMLGGLKAELALEHQRQVAFNEVLALVNAESAQKSRIVNDLEHAEHQLAEMVAEINASATSGFRALRGHLPYPTHGMIEVGFGSV